MTSHHLIEEMKLQASIAFNDRVVVKLIEDNPCISRIDMMVNLSFPEHRLEIYFCGRDTNLINSLLREGITLSNGESIKVKLNFDEVKENEGKKEERKQQTAKNDIPEGYNHFSGKFPRFESRGFNPFENRGFETNKSEKSDDQKWLEEQFGSLPTKDKDDAHHFVNNFKTPSGQMSQEDFNLKMEMDPTFRRMFSKY